MKHKYEVEMAIYFKCDAVFDIDSPEFKGALSGYKESIDKDGNIEDMLKHVIWNVYYRGQQDVEGVGHVLKDGEASFFPEFPLSGINLITKWEEASEISVDWVD